MMKAVSANAWYKSVPCLSVILVLKQGTGYLLQVAVYPVQVALYIYSELPSIKYGWGTKLNPFLQKAHCKIGNF